MKCYKRIIPLILACMMLAGCGQNVYKKGVESLENKDYAVRCNYIIEKSEFEDAGYDR